MSLAARKLPFGRHKHMRGISNCCTNASSHDLQVHRNKCRHARRLANK